MFECEQCKVWGYSGRVFDSIEAVEEHMLQVHPGRFLTMYRALVGELAHAAHSSASACRAASIKATLKARTE